MAQNKGKQFELKMREQWVKTVKDSVFYRLYDPGFGYTAVSNVGDFIGYKYPLIFIIDTKTKKGNTISFSDIRQYDKMLEYKDIKGVFTGVICFFYEKDKVVWIPIQTLYKLKQDDKKSFNIKMLDSNEYPAFEIPGKKLRTFMDTDYSKFVEYCKGEFDESTD